MWLEKDKESQIKLINQALNAAAGSLSLAKQLLGELWEDSGRKERAASGSKIPVEAKNVPFNPPGITGTYDGQFMIAADGKKYPVPENYASKSVIVYGDRLKMFSLGGESRFKQIERVKRQRTSGVLVKKEGRFHVVTSDGSHRVLPSAVSHFDLKEGGEVQIILPLDNRHAPFAAIENVSVKVAPPSPLVPPVAKVMEEIVKPLQSSEIVLEEKQTTKKRENKNKRTPDSKALKESKGKEKTEEEIEVPPKSTTETLIAEDELR